MGKMMLYHGLLRPLQGSRGVYEGFFIQYDVWGELQGNWNGGPNVGTKLKLREGRAPQIRGRGVQIPDFSRTCLHLSGIGPFPIDLLVGLS